MRPIIPLEESFRSRDGFLDFLESVITLPILLIRFSVLDPFRRSLRDGLANDDVIDGDSSRFLVCFLHSITRSLRGWITPSNALKYFMKSWFFQSNEKVCRNKNLPGFSCLRMGAILFKLDKVTKYCCQVIQSRTSRVVWKFW